MKRIESFKEIKGSIVAPRGFRASGVFCDIKRLGTGKGSEKGNKRDLALVVGGGEVAHRRVDSLLEAGGIPTVVAPQMHPEIDRLVDAGRVTELPI